MIFGRPTIKSRVLRHIEQKLDDLDTLHRDECVKIDQQAELDKERHANTLVESVVDKFV